MCNQLTGVPNCHWVQTAWISGWGWSMLPSCASRNSVQLLSPHQHSGTWMDVLMAAAMETLKAQILGAGSQGPGQPPLPPPSSSNCSTELGFSDIYGWRVWDSLGQCPGITQGWVQLCCSMGATHGQVWDTAWARVQNHSVILVRKEFQDWVYLLTQHCHIQH